MILYIALHYTYLYFDYVLFLILANRHGELSYEGFLRIFHRVPPERLTELFQFAVIPPDIDERAGQRISPQVLFPLLLFSAAAQADPYCQLCLSQVYGVFSIDAYYSNSHFLHPPLSQPSCNLLHWQTKNLPLYTLYTVFLHKI